MRFSTVLPAIVGLLLAAAPASSQCFFGNGSCQFPVSWAPIVSGFIDTHGSDATGNDWVARKALGDMMDDFFAPPASILMHPLLDPNQAVFVSTLHRIRHLQMVTRLNNEPLPAEGVRIFKTYGSGYVVQGEDAAGQRFTFAVDWVEGPFDPTPGFSPNNVPLSDADIDALAACLDIMFVTHVHGDHVSPALIEKMIDQNKMVVVTQEIRDVAVAQNSPLAQHLTVLPNSEFVTVGPLTFAAYLGAQYFDPTNINSLVNPENNCYVFCLNDVDMCHFGDNHAPGVASWLASMANKGFVLDYGLQFGFVQSLVTGVFGSVPSVKSPVFEFGHIGPAFVQWNIPASPTSSNRTVLFWGESIDVTGL